jgi:hypothetical protein
MKTALQQIESVNHDRFMVCFTATRVFWLVVTSSG